MAEENKPLDPALKRRNRNLAFFLAVVAIGLYVTFALRWSLH